jgi:trans-aconitate methyltransferase
VAESGGWEQWQWDPSLFAGAARYYEEGRLPYAPGLADALREHLGLDGRGRLLDVGCGPGTVARRLAPLFEAIVGLDPDPGMLAEAARLSTAAGITQATWVMERAESLPAGLGRFRLITFAASFHWMDRPLVATAVRTMLAPGGAVVQVDAPGYRSDDLHATTGHGGLRHPPPPDAAIDELARRFSLSVTAPHLFGDQAGQFERDLRTLLAGASPSGRFSVRLPDNILRIWQPS